MNKVIMSDTFGEDYSDKNMTVADLLGFLMSVPQHYEVRLNNFLFRKIDSYENTDVSYILVRDKRVYITVDAPGV